MNFAHSRPASISHRAIRPLSASGRPTTPSPPTRSPALCSLAAVSDICGCDLELSLSTVLRPALPDLHPRCGESPE